MTPFRTDFIVTPERGLKGRVPSRVVPEINLLSSVARRFLDKFKTKMHMGQQTREFTAPLCSFDQFFGSTDWDAGSDRLWPCVIYSMIDALCKHYNITGRDKYFFWAGITMMRNSVFH